jgi:site-specific recombinase XerD
MAFKIDRRENPNFLNEYLTHMRIVKGCLERTVFAYYIDIRMFLRYILKDRFPDRFADMELDDIPIVDFNESLLDGITKADVYAYLTFMNEERKNGAVSRARIVSSLRSFFKYLVVNTTLILSNPMENIEMHKPKTRMIKYLTLEQSMHLLDSIDTSHFERDYCIVVLFLNCGMRLSELVGLNLHDVDFSEKSMLIHGKGNKDRIIYINDACVETLQDYIASREQPDTEPNAIFLSSHKKRISTRRVQQIVENALKSAGLDGMGFSVHKLRHTSATLMYQYGETDTLVLKEVLGHSNIATTEIYTHVSNQQVRDALEDNPLADYKKRK